MHPIEHLRHVARASGADPALVAREAVSALAEMARMEPAGLVPACRRLIDRHVTAGPVWWLSARLLSADDVPAAARAAGRELSSDQTDERLAAALPDGCTVLLLGWPEMAASALRVRGDVEALIVDADGEGGPLVRWLRDRGGDVALVPESGTGPAAGVVDLVLVEAHAGGPGGVLCAPGSMAAAAVAAHRQVPVWAVAGVGRILPGRLWDALLARLDASGSEPWERNVELVEAALITAVAGPDGLSETQPGLAAATCPAAPELFRAAGSWT